MHKQIKIQTIVELNNQAYQKQRLLIIKWEHKCLNNREGCLWIIPQYTLAEVVWIKVFMIKRYVNKVRERNGSAENRNRNRQINSNLVCTNQLLIKLQSKLWGR